MKIFVLKNQLNEAIQQVAKALSNRTTIPILNGIKLDANEQGLTLTASDTEISIQSYIATEIEGQQMVRIEQPGSVVLPGKFFSEIIKKLPSNEIEIEVHPSYHTTLKSGSSEIQMVGLDPEEYPLLPSLEGSHTITLSSELLRSMIRETVFAVSTNESTPILTGVCWNFADQVLKCIATDRHRLASRQETLQQTIPTDVKNIVISGRALNELSKIIPDQHTNIDMVFTEHQILFKLDSVLFYSRLLEGTYPDTSKIIPQEYKTEFVIETKLFLEAMDRAYLLSREEKTNIVRLITKDDRTIEISSSLSELGKITEQMPVQDFKGEELRISFNSKYMLDALKVIDSESIHIGFVGPMSPIILKPKDEEHMLHLILPYRTTN